MPWPHGDNCQCPQPPADAGLLAYTVDCAHHAQLAAALHELADPPAKVTLRILTHGQPPANLVPIDAPAHDGTMTCQCPACQQERAARVRQGVRRSTGGIPIKHRRVTA